MADLVVVGAGPCGLAAAVEARKAGFTATVFDRGPVVAGIASYPTYMTFFSTCDRLSIGDIPFVVAAAKPTRRDALAYYREVARHFALDIRQYEEVTSVSEATDPGKRWEIRSRDRYGDVHLMKADAVIVATGYFGRPRRPGFPGNELPHVRHGYSEGHFAWNEDVLIVGGGNSAVDAALEMHRAGARVSVVHYKADFDPGVKPWVRPEINARITDGTIRVFFRSRVELVEPGWAHLVEEMDRTVSATDGATPEDRSDGAGGARRRRHRIRATQVYEMTGYLPETGLLESLGVPIDPESGIPAHDPVSMATPLPGVYLAGVIASGNDANRIFIENGRDHGKAIIADILQRDLTGRRRTSG